jgi:hypothetical protein
MAVVTPSTLVIVSSSTPNVTAVSAALSVLSYDKTGPWAQWTGGGGVDYAGASRRILRLAASVAAQGAVLPIAAPYPNSSYTLEFLGPSLSCGLSLNASLSRTIGQTIVNQSCTDDGCSGAGAVFVSFVPTYNSPSSNETDTVSTNVLSGLSAVLNATDLATGSVTTDRPSTLDRSPTSEHMKLFVVVPGGSSTGYFANTTIECGLYNASYSVGFNFTNGLQTVNVLNRTLLNGVPFNLTGPGDTGQPASIPAVAYTSLMDSLGGLLVGVLDFSHYGEVTPHLTQIMSTVLVETQELASESGAADVEPPTIANMTMTDALEDLFTNFTLSLFSDSYFL